MIELHIHIGAQEIVVFMVGYVIGLVLCAVTKILLRIIMR